MVTDLSTSTTPTQVASQDSNLISARDAADKKESFSKNSRELGRVTNKELRSDTEEASSEVSEGAECTDNTVDTCQPQGSIPS